MALGSGRCDVCHAAIFRDTDKYRLYRDECYTMLGEMFVSALADLPMNYTPESRLSCRHCRGLIFKVTKCKQQLGALQAELRSKLSSGQAKNVFIRLHRPLDSLQLSSAPFTHKFLQLMPAMLLQYMFKFRSKDVGL